jgi:hypothetical protein
MFVCVPLGAERSRATPPSQCPLVLDEERCYRRLDRWVVGGAGWKGERMHSVHIDIMLLTMIEGGRLMFDVCSFLLSRGSRNSGTKPHSSEQIAGRLTTARENCHTINPP